MTRKITQGDRRSLRRIVRKHIVRSDHDFGMLRTEYIERVEVDDMAADLVEWADRRALRTASAPAPSVVPEAAVERAARAMQAENAPKPDPLNRDQREEQDDATIATYRTLARAALARRRTPSPPGPADSPEAEVAAIRAARRGFTHPADTD